MGIQTGAITLQWLVLRMGGADTDSSYIVEHVESLIRNYVSNSFHGGMFIASANFRAVLHVNSSLICHIAMAWPCDSLS